MRDGTSRCWENIVCEVCFERLERSEGNSFFYFFYSTTPRRTKLFDQGSKDDSLEDSYIVEYASNNGCIVGEVVDTRGDLHTLMKKQFFKLLSHSDGFVLVFSIDNDDSFQYLKELCNDIQSYAYGNVPILIVCNKCDLEENRQVTTKVLSHLVDHIGCKLLNTSVRYQFVTFSPAAKSMA